MMSPDAAITSYYRTYDKLYNQEFPEYFVPQGALWELPLWVAHITALLDSAGMESTFANLSKVPPVADLVVDELMSSTSVDDIVLLSPLAQNFALALMTGKLLEQAGRKVVIGGNMAGLTPPGWVHLVHRGQLDLGVVSRLRSLIEGTGGVLTTPMRQGRSGVVEWVPSYRHLAGGRGDLPLLRLNASHGCLYRCEFCGDAWSSQLTIVSPGALSAELDELGRLFPKTKLLYVGDKTFGQSQVAVKNLNRALAGRGYDVVMQTHVLQINDRLIDDMLAIGTRVVELGFESADTEMLTTIGKSSKGLDDYTARIERLCDAGLLPVLNVLGALWAESERSHALTVDWLAQHQELVWLCNVYNFVPYPLTPVFGKLRGRIFDWDFARWREDLPPIYHPLHLTPQRSWELFKEKVDVAHTIARARVRDIAAADT